MFGYDGRAIDTRRFKCLVATMRARVHAGRDDSYSSLGSGVLKIVTRLAWENSSNPIIYVSASRSYPCLFVSHYVLQVFV